MKNQRFTKIISARKSGFALVVTLTLMVLLSILALGMLSLSSIELRKSTVSKHQSIARQNALLALQLAIGGLQEHLGPDKRTSANADLLANNSPNPHWVGAWNTEGGFRNWLVSGNETTTPANNPKDDAAAPAHLPGAKLTSANSGDPGVVLVGGNSSGSDFTNHVTAPVVNLKSQVSGDTEGRYAWWVGDEGAKASLGIPVRPVPTSGVAERLAFSSSFLNRGFPTLGGKWEKWLPDGDGAVLESTAGKLVTRRQVPLSDSGDPHPTGDGNGITLQPGEVKPYTITGGIRRQQKRKTPHGSPHSPRKRSSVESSVSKREGRMKSVWTYSFTS